MNLFSLSIKSAGAVFYYDNSYVPQGVGFIFSSLGIGEVLFVLLVALVLFGAERLPSLARTLGNAWNEMRRAADELVHSITDANVSPSSNHTVSDHRNQQTNEEEERKG